jgi:drug/metabolite transporter (DMT)-like permease
MAAPAAEARLSDNLRGALWMLCGAVTFTAMTSLIKYLGDGYSPALQLFYRQAAGLIVMAPIILRDPVGVLQTKRFGMLSLRAIGTAAAMTLGFYSYQHMPLAEANALSFTRTLWMAPLAMLLLGEKVGPWRFGATLAGFGGVLLILQPSANMQIGWPVAAALGSAAIFALTITGVKFMTRDHSVTALTAWAAVLGFVIATPLAIATWRWPTPLDAVLLATMGVLGLATQVCAIKGMQAGDATVMAPIDYTRLIFAVLVGMIVFHDLPAPLTILGALIIIASTLVITLREARLAKPTPPPTE